ncbi:MAG: glycine betaine/L-proline ABC transporter ATP-binding protein [Candidatus Pelethousia sp.]|nr:glycine betaine/L-proline ABC transporter ATP-binding protein [Candidatus Pelethousia sp.]
MSDIIIETRNLSKLYGLRRDEAVEMLSKGADKDNVLRKTGVTTALYDINLNIPRGEIFTIIGLSGSGKSTLVRCFNRLNRPSSGSILFDGIDLMKMSKQELREFRRHKAAMVFQSFGLMSHRNVLGNVAYGLEVCGVSREERETRAMEAISLVGLEGWEKATIESLSGGMRQRVGLARALANDPEVLLMDEPFSALDPLVRNDMQFELMDLQKKLNKTIIFITHDINEAFKLGDTVAIMRDGRMEQVDTPAAMSQHPANDYVRTFINSADKTRVLSVRDIMLKPACLVRLTDSLTHAIREMRTNGVSSVYVRGQSMRLKGILTIDEAIRAHREGLTISDVLQADISTVPEDTLISDVLPIAAEARVPIAVVDENGALRGIVTKAAVLSSML